MVTAIEAGAPGTLAFRLSGRLTRADYQDVLLPPIQATIERGEPLRVLALVEDFTGVESGPLVGELKAMARLGSAQDAIPSSFAVVSGADWVRRAVALFGWLIPGRARAFSARADAEAWLAGQA
jgi:hypothetical protein